MAQLYRDGIDARINHAKSSLIKNFENMKDDLDDIMEMHLKNGYYGWEFMREPFLWRDECKYVILDIDKKIKDLGYILYMNNKYHTLAILPPENFATMVKDCIVGWDDDQQFIHYTLDDHNLDIMKKWKEDAMIWQNNINDRIKYLEKKLESCYDLLNAINPSTSSI